MRRFRIDVFPMLVIMAGGVVGALLTLSPVLLLGPLDDVFAPVQPVLSPPEEAPVVVRPVAGRTVPVWSPNGTSVVYEDANGNVYRADSGGGVAESVQFSPDGQWIVYRYRSITSAEETAEPEEASSGVIRVTREFATLNRPLR